MTGLTLTDPAFVGAAARFNPLSLSPALWLDASDTSTITASSGRVSQWNDKSGNNVNVVQTSASLQPVTGSTTLNSKNVIDFTSNRRMSLQNSNILNNVSAASIYVVVNGTYSPTSYQTFCSFTANNLAGASRAGLFAFGGTMRAGGRRLDANSFQFVSTGSTTNSQPYIVAGLFDWANAALTVKLNSTATNRTGGFQTSGNTSATSSRILLGASDENAESYTGSIAEVIVANRLLSASEQSSLETYFSEKWNIAL